MINYFGGNVLLGSIILTIVILIFSEITPKTIATIKPESFATKSSFILNILVTIFKPLIFLTNFLSRLILKIFKLDTKDATLNDNLNTEELKTLLEESGDLIPKQYRIMLSSVLGMEELVVEDIMVPTSEIIGIDVNKSYDDATKIIEYIFKEITGKFGGDKQEHEKEFHQQTDGSILTDGNSKIRELNNYLGWDILEDGPKTINGLITEYLDQIPQANLCIEIEGYRFEILELDENLISKIKIAKI